MSDEEIKKPIRKTKETSDDKRWKVQEKDLDRRTDFIFRETCESWPGIYHEARIFLKEAVGGESVCKDLIEAYTDVGVILKEHSSSNNAPEYFIPYSNILMIKEIRRELKTSEII